MICIATVIINLTPIWNKIDEMSVKSAQAGCAKSYPDAPCLIKLTKTKENTYRAICGEKR